MTALLIIVVLMISCILLIYFHQQDSRADSTLQMLLDNDGTFPDMKDPSQPDNSGGRIPGQGPRGADFDAARAIEMPFETRYFTVRLDADGNILSTDVDHIAAISSEDAESYAASAFSSGKTKGYLDGYKFADNVQDNGVTLIVAAVPDLHPHCRYHAGSHARPRRSALRQCRCAGCGIPGQTEAVHLRRRT